MRDALTFLTLLTSLKVRVASTIPLFSANPLTSTIVHYGAARETRVSALYTRQFALIVCVVSFHKLEKVERGFDCITDALEFSCTRCIVGNAPG